MEDKSGKKKKKNKTGNHTPEPKSQNPTHSFVNFWELRKGV